MCATPASSLPSAEPSFDLSYSIHDIEVDAHLDSQFLYRRLEEVMLNEGATTRGRTLDVACGTGALTARLRQRGVEGWGLDPSLEMLGLNRWLFPDEKVVLVRGIAERLPFLDASFDRVICQASLDHFVHPEAFMQEAARILKPEGRLIIALANYESLSCRLGRLRHRLASTLFRRPPWPHRPNWQPPPDHYHKGDLAFVRSLGSGRLRLERCYGISLMWLVYGWGMWLERLPRLFAATLLPAFDWIAYRAPIMADMVISIWCPTDGDQGNLLAEGMSQE